MPVAPYLTGSESGEAKGFSPWAASLWDFARRDPMGGLGAVLPQGQQAVRLADAMRARFPIFWKQLSRLPFDIKLEYPFPRMVEGEPDALFRGPGVSFPASMKILQKPEESFVHEGLHALYSPKTSTNMPPGWALPAINARYRPPAMFGLSGAVDPGEQATEALTQNILKANPVSLSIWHRMFGKGY